MYNGIKSRKAFCKNEAEDFANEVGMSYIFTNKNASAASRNSCSLQVYTPINADKLI